MDQDFFGVGSMGSEVSGISSDGNEVPMTVW